MQPLRQGDVLLLPTQAFPTQTLDGQKLPHLTLAEGEVTGYKHRISDGQAELYETDGTLYLKVLSDTATLTHEEHQAIAIPKGTWMIRLQREYEPEGWRLQKPRVLGLHAGSIQMSDDFDEPLPDEFWLGEK